MSYSYSNTDDSNLRWFHSDMTRATLLTVDIRAGRVRGLKDLRIDFRYPITALAGRNGSGKTTILALAACAYHNRPGGYLLSGRLQSYYTFSDFFVQASDDVPVEGIAISYQFLHNSWRKTKSRPGGEGAGWQTRLKRRGGKWNKYSRRINRTVAYLGIRRVVPHAEKSVSRSYHHLFKEGEPSGWEGEVCGMASRILGSEYSSLAYKQHSKYSLAVVKSSTGTYSGFNMGAGEDALFELLSVLMEVPDGSLILIDEIELGLHEDAQARLIDVLKELCHGRHIQIICTTHSPRVLESLPPEGRVFLEREGDATRVVPGISPEYATGKLAGRSHVELDVLVEDNVAVAIVQAALSSELRARVDVLPIGSDQAVMKHLAARYREQRLKRRTPDACVILDGDRASAQASLLSTFVKTLELPKDDSSATSWAKQRIHFLPGQTWPEAWLVGMDGASALQALAVDLGLPVTGVPRVLEAARCAGKHNEIREIAAQVSLGDSLVLNGLIRAAMICYPDARKLIVDTIEGLLM